ncbi:tho complex [Salix suchowensis]|nr:tho complex [Salix suchowensis]
MQRPVPMQGTFPNIINLPYGKCPPLHLQAPTWRSLLKLMARLSGTKVEPTIEGIAVAKHALHLRTVVQLVKFRAYDSPRLGLSCVQVLRYTLNGEPTVPLPPGDFPEPAMYLQAALEESRRYINDSSSGMRKLAKMVDQAFPNSHIDTDLNDNDERSGVGGLFKRVIGRGTSPDVAEGTRIHGTIIYQEQSVEHFLTIAPIRSLVVSVGSKYKCIHPRCITPYPHHYARNAKVPSMATTQNNAAAQAPSLNSNRDQNILFPPLTTEEKVHANPSALLNVLYPTHLQLNSSCSIVFRSCHPNTHNERRAAPAARHQEIPCVHVHRVPDRQIYAGGAGDRRGAGGLPSGAVVVPSDAEEELMICEGEVRQVEEYQRERLRIEDEHGTLKGQIEQLKTSLEHAQLQRRRKLEYDAIAEKVNMLPSREELEQSVSFPFIHPYSKDVDMASTSVANTPRVSPGPDEGRETVDSTGTGRESSRGEASMDMDIKEEKEEGETFSDNNRVDSEPAEGQVTRAEGSEAGQNDIEMGEVEEDNSNLGKGSKVKRIRKELEEGEASDESSELSDAPE